MFNTEFLSPTVVQGQCAPGQTGAAVVFGGEPPGGVLAAAAPVVVATPAAAMNQLGTVYATKRRRRNGKRYVMGWMEVQGCCLVLLPPASVNNAELKYQTGFLSKRNAQYICMEEVLT